MIRAILRVGAWVAAGLAAAAEPTIDPAHPYAYGANLGWMNARPDLTNGAVIGRSFCAGGIYGANVGWISLGAGAPTNGYAYGNAAANDYGVNHDGAGRLSGHAYGANIGWVAFEQTHGRPRIDLRTGDLSGYAWGANVGWISLSNAQACLRTERLDVGPDTDGDGLPDAYEYRHTNDLRVLDGRFGRDSDGDGATDLEESVADTDPLDPASNLEVVGTAQLPNIRRLTWTVSPARFYRVEETAALTHASGWAESALGLMAPDPGATMTRDVPDPGATSRFYRVKAIVPLSD